MNNKNTRPPALRKWSQNFLNDPNVARKIAHSLNYKEPCLTIEIGPGKGILTRFLIDNSKKLICVEIDPFLAKNLSEILNHPENLTIVQSDFLEWDLHKTLESYSTYHRVLIGNLPYHITSPILFKVLKNSENIDEAVFTIQKEVAQRICAPPGSKTYGIISVFCQLYATVEYLFTIPSHLFSPVPKVDSGVIRLKFTPAAENRLLNSALFRELVRHTFGQRRKMLRNTLSTLYPQFILDQLHIDLTRRPETLSVDEFAELSNELQTILTRN
jgi:16S rRNA (adenine1518-N6/adenine1519-N6)-dimethyltransferase